MMHHASHLRVFGFEHVWGFPSSEWRPIPKKGRPMCGAAALAQRWLQRWFNSTGNVEDRGRCCRIHDLTWFHHQSCWKRMLDDLTIWQKKHDELDFLHFDMAQIEILTTSSARPTLQSLTMTILRRKAWNGLRNGHWWSINSHNF